MSSETERDRVLAELKSLRFVALFSLTVGAEAVTFPDKLALARSAGLNAGVLGLERSDGSTLTWDLDEVGNSIKASDAIESIFNSWNKLLTIAIHDALQALPNFPDPEIKEFARHLRNAAAHNMHFDIRGNPEVARFNDLEITKTDDGRPIYDVVTPGDIWALLEEVIHILDIKPRGAGSPC